MGDDCNVEGKCEVEVANKRLGIKEVLIMARIRKTYNCVFSFQYKFHKQLQGVAMGSPVTPVIANISMEYFEELALGPHCPMPTPLWKRYVDHVICITKKTKWTYYSIT